MTPDALLRERMLRAKKIAATHPRYEVRLRAQGRYEAYKVAGRIVRRAK